MATTIVTCPDASWSYLPNFANSGLRLPNVSNGQVLASITLYMAKFTNYGFYIDIYGTIIPAGATTGANTVTVRLKVNGVYSKETHTVTNKVPIMGDHTPPGTWAPCEESDKYVFTFDDIPISNNQRIDCIVTGVDNYSTGLTIYDPSNGQRGYAEVYDEPRGPSSITVTPASGDDGWITDLTGVTRNQSQGVLKDYTCKYNLIPNPSTAKITEVTFSDENYVTSQYNNGVITVTARNRTTDYPITDNVNVTVNGGASTDFDVNFYEKVKAALAGISNLELNIRTAANKGFILQNYNPSTINSASDRSLFLDGNYLTTFSPQNSNTLLNVGQYLQLQSNSSNLFKISGEGYRHSLKWRFFNHFVQTNTSEIGTYKVDLDTNVTWYITPNMISQFSFEWLDVNNVPVTNYPEIIVPEFDSPIIGNLKYTNAAVSGGYCRGFRVRYIQDDTGSVVRTDYFNASISDDGTALFNKRILNKSNLTGIPFNKYVTIEITMYFYFNDSVDVRYYGASYTLSQKLYRIDKTSLYPTLVFPIVSTSSPYSAMMLEDVERFGYEIPDIALKFMNMFNLKYGLLINGVDVNVNNNPNIVSSNKITKHMVYDIGKYVKDNSLYLTELTILPYVDVYSDKPYAKRIMADDRSNATPPNAIINTSLDTMWNRPIAQKGEYIKYFDADRFMQFINKYHALYNNQILSVSLDKRGDIINTDFWVDIANKLDVYAQNMQNWATDVTNYIVLWSLPKFKHKKGELITNNNVYQNYYDLLIQYSGYGNFVTHNYLHNNNYTHDDLNHYTHNEITNKDGI